MDKAVRNLLIVGSLLAAFLLVFLLLVLPASVEQTSTSITYSTKGTPTQTYTYSTKGTPTQTYTYGEEPSLIDWPILITNVAAVLLTFGIFIIFIIFVTLLVRWVWTKW